MPGLAARLIGISAIAVACLGAGQAAAQDAVAPATATDTADTGLEEIVVTAQKRAQSLQDIPVAISAVDGDTLRRAGVTSSTDIFKLVPNLTVNKTFDLSNPRIFLRGVGSSDFNANSATPIGIYVDEVFVSDGSALVFQLLDTERVEVLRGPQGPLYGRNTTAGAINYISRAPTEEFEGFASARYGNFNELNLQGVVSGSLAEGLTARVAVGHFQRDSFLFNRLTDERTPGARATSGRLLLRWEANDKLTFDLNLHAGEGSTGQFSQHRGVASTPTGGACTPALAVALQCVDFLGYRDTDGDPFAADLDRVGREEVETVGGSFKLTADLGFASLVSITAWDRVKRQTGLDNDVSPADVFTVNFGNRSDQVTQEFRLTSPGGKRFNWILGAYLYRFTVRATNDYDVFRVLRPAFGFNPQPQPGQPLVGFVDQRFRQQTNAVAVFGHADFELAEGLKLFGGLRYTSERGRFATDVSFTEPNFAIPIFVDEQRRFSESNVSGDIAIDYELADDVKVYAKLARGFKSGGFNGGVVFNPRQLDPYDSEILTSYELGLKSEFFDRRVRLNIAAFQYSYSDLQLFTLVNSGGVPTSILDNAGRARVRGLEVELSARPLQGLTLNAAVGLLDTKLTEFITSGGVDYTGNQLPGAPDFTGSVSADYRFDIGTRHQLTLRGDVSHRSSSYYTVANIERLRQAARTLVNARIEFATQDERWQIAIYGRNIFKKRYEVAVQDFADFGFDYIVPGDPRTFGIEVGFNF